jgi:DNA replication ATP-dependent helicase Dna2
VIVSTTSSLFSNSEIFFIKDFDTVIIDEASQILEPQIVGILARAERFIMIGDEKQMPAVVLQRNNFDSSKYPELQKIGLNDLSGSLFETTSKELH